MINRIEIRYSRLIWITAIILLLLNGVSALAAGYAFMADPSGKTLGMTTAYLRHSPFNNFFIPGIALFLIIGLMSVIISVIALSRGILYHLLISLEGACLIGLDSGTDSIFRFSASPAFCHGRRFDCPHSIRIFS
jgi:hypothetical protein